MLLPDALAAYSFNRLFMWTAEEIGPLSASLRICARQWGVNSVS